MKCLFLWPHGVSSTGRHYQPVRVWFHESLSQSRSSLRQNRMVLTFTSVTDVTDGAGPSRRGHCSLSCARLDIQSPWLRQPGGLPRSLQREHASTTRHTTAAAGLSEHAAGAPSQRRLVRDWATRRRTEGEDGGRRRRRPLCREPLTWLGAPAACFESFRSLCLAWSWAAPTAELSHRTDSRATENLCNVSGNWVTVKQRSVPEVSRTVYSVGFDSRLAHRQHTRAQRGRHWVSMLEPGRWPGSRAVQYGGHNWRWCDDGDA